MLFSRSAYQTSPARKGLILPRSQPDCPAPHTLRSERKGRCDVPAATDAACGQNRHRGRADVHDLWHQNHGRYFAGVTTGLGTYGNDDVHARLALCDGVRRLSA